MGLRHKPIKRLEQKPMPAAIPKVPLLHIPQRVKAGLIVFVVAMDDGDERLVVSGGGEVVGHRKRLKRIRMA